MLVTSVQSLHLIGCKLWEELITQTCFPTLTANLKIVLRRNAVILLKIIFSCAKIHMHIFNIHNKYA